MKNSRILFVALTTMLMASCSKDDENMMPNTQQITEEEAVAIVELSLEEKSAGLAKTTYECTKTYQEVNSFKALCNQTLSDGYNVSYNGQVVEVDYDVDWDFTLNCNNYSMPQSATFSAAGKGLYATQNIASDDSSTFSATITGLQSSEPAVVYNGSFSREGSQEITTESETKSISTNFTSNFNNLMVNKSDYKIASGTGTFTLTGKSNNATFSYQGEITFYNDSTATILINENQFTISLK